MPMDIVVVPYADLKRFKKLGLIYREADRHGKIVYERSGMEAGDAAEWLIHAESDAT